MSAWAKQPHDSDETLIPSSPSTITGAPKIVKKPDEGPKEKITSQTRILLDDTSSEWSEDVEQSSLATTTVASVAPSMKSTATSLRKMLDLGVAKRRKDKIDLEKKIVIPGLAPDIDKSSHVSLRESLKSKQSLQASHLSGTDVRSNHAESMLNDAVLMDRTLDDIQEVSRKRPKDLMLGKFDIVILSFQKWNILRKIVFRNCFESIDNRIYFKFRYLLPQFWRNLSSTYRWI